MTDWLSGMVGDGAAPAFALLIYGIAIIAVLLVLAWIVRRLTGGTFVAGGAARRPRLAILDAAAIDSRRRLVLVRCDDTEHLLLIGGSTDIVVEKNIHLAEAPARSGRTAEGAALPPGAAESMSPGVPIEPPVAAVKSDALLSRERPEDEIPNPARHAAAVSAASASGSVGGETGNTVSESAKFATPETVKPTWSRRFPPSDQEKPQYSDAASSVPADGIPASIGNEPAETPPESNQAQETASEPPAYKLAQVSTNDDSERSKALEDEMERLLQELSSGRR